MMYLIWSNEHQRWWAHNREGYTLDLNEAGRYDRREALKVCHDANYYQAKDRAPNEVPVLEADAWNIAVGGRS